MSMSTEFMDEVDTAKAALRDQARQRRQKLSDSFRRQAATDAAGHFFTHVPLKPDMAVAGFWSIRDEIDTRPLLTRLMDDGSDVCLPVIDSEAGTMKFRRWEVGAPLFPAGFGTLQPAESAVEVEPEILVMPLLGFDRVGTRLGYGGGYYDRAISAMGKRPILIGYAFSTQEFDHVPPADHDISLDMVITEAGPIRFTSAAG